MLEEIIEELAKRGLTVEISGAWNGARGVRYKATVRNLGAFDVKGAFPSFEFSTGAWDVETLRANINEDLVLVEPIIANTERFRSELSRRVHPNIDPKTAKEFPIAA